MSKFIIIDKSDYINAINLQLGLYQPLKGFVNLEEFKNILSNKEVHNSKFTIPINLFCSKKNFDEFKLGDKIYFKYKSEVVGSISLESKFKINKSSLLNAIFGTTNKIHLGVDNYLKKLEKKSYALGGRVSINQSRIKKFFKFSNYDTLKKIEKIKYRDIAFSTRNIPHIGHNLIQKKIIESKKKLSIFLILSIKNKYSSNDLMNSYVALKKNKTFKYINIFFIYLPTFYAGPNEAFFQAKIFENLKYKFFYVGRDHAGYKSFYKKFDSQNIFKKIKTKIKIITFNEPMMCNSCNVAVLNKYKNKKSCPVCSGNKLSELNGTDIKILIQRNRTVLLSNLLDPFVQKFFKIK